MFGRICSRTKTFYNPNSRLLQFTTNRLSSTNSAEETGEKNTSGGYAKAFEKFENIQDDSNKSAPQTFASLLRNSRLMDMGDPEGKMVTGKIFHIVNDDLYIDFGWKFHCVCHRPKKNASSYVRGARVRLVIKDLELSSRFLGFEKDITLLEADCHLLGIVQERGPDIQDNKNM